MLLCVVYVLFGVYVYTFFYKRTGDALNPFSVSIGILLITFGFTHLKLNSFQSDISILTHLAIILVASEMTLVGCRVIPKDIKKYNKQPVITKEFKTNTWIVFYIVLLCIIYIFVRNGFNLNSFRAGNNAFDMKSEINVYEGAGVLGYIAYLVPFIPIYIFYILLFDENKTKRQIIIYIGIIAFSCFYVWQVLMSRGTLLITAAGILLLLNKKYCFSVKRVVIIFVVMIVASGLLMQERLNSASNVFYGKMNPILNSAYNYVVFCYENLDKILNHGSPYTVLTTVWKSFSKILRIYDESLFLEYTTYFYNARTFLYYYFHDMGWFGLLIYPSLLYYIIGKIYVKSRISKPQYYLFLATMGKAMIVVFFGNYFFGAFSSDVAYIVTGILLLFSYRYKLKIRVANTTIKNFARNSNLT